MLDVIFWVAIIVMVISFSAYMYSKVSGKTLEQMKRDAELKKIERSYKASDYRPSFRYDYDTLYLFDSNMENKFMNYYRDELYENDEYNYTAKELKEDYMDEKVYKYAPLDLPFKTEGDTVYSKLNEEWVRIGKIKSRDVEKLDKGEVTLALYPKIYKYVTEEGIERVNDDPYFALTVKTKVDL